jgi:hypothetical protein
LGRPYLFLVRKPCKQLTNEEVTIGKSSLPPADVNIIIYGDIHIIKGKENSRMGRIKESEYTDLRNTLATKYNFRNHNNIIRLDESRKCDAHNEKSILRFPHTQSHA